jgi:hypothetical protein
VESNLAEGPAKLIKQFWWNFEWNSNSAGMVPGITRTELHRNGIRGICRVHNNIQIERRQTPTLDLGVINKQQTLSPPPPPSTTPTHRRFLTTVASSPLPRHRHHQHSLPLSMSIPNNHQTTNDVATPCHRPNERRPLQQHTRTGGIQGATSLSATWQAHGE